MKIIFNYSFKHAVLNYCKLTNLQKHVRIHLTGCWTVDDAGRQPNKAQQLAVMHNILGQKIRWKRKIEQRKYNSQMAMKCKHVELEKESWCINA